MTRTEIKAFLVDTADKKEIPVTLPVSVYQALGESVGGTVRLYTVINADERLLDGEYVYLRIKDLRHSAAVSLNGLAIGMPTAEEPIYSYDIKDRLTPGENLLEIAFSGEAHELSSAGIFGGVEIVKFSNQMIDSLSVETSREGGDATVTVRLSTVGSGDAVRAVATLVSGSGQIYYAGLTKGKGKITVKDPLFWWPRGVGIQNLYKLTVNLYGESEIEDTAELRVGFASLTTDGGVTEVNGEPFIPLGAVYSEIKADSPEQERLAINAYAVSLWDAGVNTLIIPESVGRISDTLYDLCDLYGIAVVHEISAVGSLIKARLIHQGYRPSVGMIDLIGDGDDMEKITETLRLVCPKADVNCVGRSEYVGLYTLPTERTLSELVPEGERNPFSAALDSAKDGILEIISRASNEYPYAPDLCSLAYVSELSGAKETESALLLKRLNSRRAAYSARSDASGLLSTGILDGAYRRKALYYYLKRSFAPTLLYAIGDGGALDFYVMRSERRELSGTAELRLVDASGETIFAQSVEVGVPKTSATKIFSRDLTDKISGREREVYLEYSLKDETGVLSKRIHLFCEIRKYKFAKPSIKAEIVGEDRRFALTLSAGALAVGVEVSFDGDEAILSDNCFDMASGEKRKVVVTTSRATSRETLIESMKIRTVNELMLK